MPQPQIAPAPTPPQSEKSTAPESARAPRNAQATAPGSAPLTSTEQTGQTKIPQSDQRYERPYLYPKQQSGYRGKREKTPPFDTGGRTTRKGGRNGGPGRAGAAHPNRLAAGILAYRGQAREPSHLLPGRRAAYKGGPRGRGGDSHEEPRSSSS
ncbi:hypothetical protein NL676_014904 [Syzygium grande]|nr:hypothetical protein NL676_014904 [Syzygium grande]